jgi:hypothetical protein
MRLHSNTECVTHTCQPEFNGLTLVDDVRCGHFFGGSYLLKACLQLAQEMSRYYVQLNFKSYTILARLQNL